MQNFDTISAPVVFADFLPLFCAVFRGDGFPRAHVTQAPTRARARLAHIRTHGHMCTHATPTVNF